MPKRSKRLKDGPARAKAGPRPKVRDGKPATSPASSERPTCFLSHAHEDAEFAYRVETVLAKHGIEAWYAPGRIKGGQDWHDAIGDALERCNWFIVVLSPRAVGSTWVSKELKYALNEPRLVGRIIPLWYRSCEYRKLSWTLDSIKIIDFRRRFGSGCQELLRIWGIEYQL